MTPLWATYATPLAVVAGLASHVLYFQRHEFHKHVEAIFNIAVSVTVGGPLLVFKLLNTDLLYAVAVVMWFEFCMVGAAVTSTMVYRAFLNPLNKFPGPYAARLTDLWMAFHVGRKLDSWLKLEKLHKRYGPIVRIGATHLSIAGPEWSDQLFLDTVKGYFFDIDYPHHSIHEERDLDLHAKKRALWAPAFSDRALRGYQTHVSAVNRVFLRRISQNEGKVINISRWIAVYGFHCMLAVTFGRTDYEFDPDHVHEALANSTEGMGIIGLNPPAWLIRTLKMLPGNPMKKFHAFTDHELAVAVQRDMTPNSDSLSKNGNCIVGYLGDIYAHLPDPARDPMFRVDGRLLIVAGSETTSAGMAFVFYRLAKHPEHVEKIRKELHDMLDEGSCTVTDAEIAHNDHLNGFIWESLRLHSPGPSGTYRATPPQGLQLGEHFIPGDTQLRIPGHVMQRDPLAFPRPLEFIPERWYSQPELVLNKSAWSIFGKGPMNCIGRAVALMELRTVTAETVLRYNIQFAPHENGHRIVNESIDHFTMACAPCDVIFTPVDHK